MCTWAWVWRPEDTLGAISQELLTLVLEAGSLTNLGSWIGLAWLLGSPRDPPVCAFPTSGFAGSSSDSAFLCRFWELSAGPHKPPPA